MDVDEHVDVHVKTKGTCTYQLDRAAASIVLNVAEGAGRTSAADRGHFFAIARGSAFESAAVLDILHARGALATPAHREGRTLLVRVVQMLSKLIARRSGLSVARPKGAEPTR